MEGTPDNPAPLTEHDARLETLLRDAIASVLDCFAAARPGFEEAVHLFNQGGVTCDKLDSNRPERDGWETFGAISRLNDLATLAAATAIILTDSSVRTGDPDAEPEDWPTRSVLHRGRTFVGGRIHVEDGIYRIDAHVVAANEVIDLDAIGGGR